MNYTEKQLFNQVSKVKSIIKKLTKKLLKEIPGHDLEYKFYSKDMFNKDKEPDKVMTIIWKKVGFFETELFLNIEIKIFDKIEKWRKPLKDTDWIDDFNDDIVKIYDRRYENDL